MHREPIRGRFATFGCENIDNQECIYITVKICRSSRPIVLPIYKTVIPWALTTFTDKLLKKY